ncbi:hypothetical protein [Desulfovibrio sp. JC010]|uniref:hypothetical protein n=1 Tax=Desulfovibrio sp. JC010 TaxID=2593641 RepID=UPI0013D8584F|nr:hypothetical protein [Desulfovibrio sp. JC010]
MAFAESWKELHRVIQGQKVKFVNVGLDFVQDEKNYITEVVRDAYIKYGMGRPLQRESP